jgi:hypothetical protein
MLRGIVRRRSARLIGAAAALTIVAGCGGPSSPLAATTAPTATATATATASSARPSASVATADPASAALNAFVVFATNARASYQATFTGHQRATVTVVNITKGVLQVSGSDVLVRATFTFPRGDAYAVEHRYVGGRAWLRTSPAGWGRLTPFAADQSMGAFAQVHGAADVTPLGPATVKGRTFYKVRIPSTIVNPVMVPAINLSDRAVTDSRLDLLIDAAGHPVSGEAEIRGQGRVSGQLQEIAIDLSVTFTKIGTAVSISAP